jgi:hypothetical protein
MAMLALVATIVLGLERPAGAGETLELAGKAGFLSAPIRGGTTPFGAGFGGRFGVDLARFYLGVSVVDYLGGSDVSLSDHAMLFGVEVGYGAPVATFGSSRLVLRPQLGVGDAAVIHTDPSLGKADIVSSASGTKSSGGDSVTVNNVYVEPALVLLLLGERTFFAVAANAMVVPHIAYGGGEPETWISYGVQGQFGARF